MGRGLMWWLGGGSYGGREGAHMVVGRGLI